MLPLISVILPVRNERTMLPKLLDELLMQNYPADRFEILVVDGRSTDGTADLVRRRYSDKRVKVRVLDNPKVRTSAGRNAGIRAAAGDVIVFIDGHCAIPSRNLLEDTAAILGQTGAGCLCRPQPLLAPSATRTGEVIAQARTSWLAHGRDARAHDMHTSGFVDPVISGATYRREVFDKAGFYDENFDGCEDLEFNTRVHKAGIKGYTDPRLAVYYAPRTTMRGLLLQMIRNGRGRLRLARKHSETFSISQLMPVAILLAVLLTPLAWALLPRTDALVATLPLALFAAAAAAASLQMGFRHGFAHAWKGPRIFGAMYCGLGAGLLVEALRPARPMKSAVLEVLRPAPELQIVEETKRAA
jgi:glycosyltransferase involved in cell wall biosynthesis